MTTATVLAAEYLGHIGGGLEYLYASWALTYAGLVAYALSLAIRRRGETRRG